MVEGLLRLRPAVVAPTPAVDVLPPAAATARVALRPAERCLSAGIVAAVAEAPAASPGLHTVCVAAALATARGARSWGRGRRPSARRSRRTQLAATSLQAPSWVYFPPGAAVDDVFLNSLIGAQRAHAGEVVLALGDAVRLVEAAAELLRSEETLPRVDFETVVVVGDIHGQFYDLLRIFDLAGRPSEDNPYLFNGDFVDRGAHSLEVILTLFALKLRFPKAVRMNRGNHEAVDLNLRYGFANEIRDRYGPQGKRLFDACSEAFRWLPLAHVVSSEVFVVHGGLPGPDPRLQFADAGGGGTGYDSVVADEEGRSGGRRGGGQQLSLLGYNPDNVSLPPRREELSLAEIAALPRGVEPATDLRALDALPEDQAETQRLIVDLLWADPRGKTGYGPSFRVRKGCYIFGPDVSEAFLRKNGLRLLIRSHEVKVGGYEWTHPAVITVFSAPNYLGHARNKGAVVRLSRNAESGALEPTFITYEATEATAYVAA